MMSSSSCDSAQGEKNVLITAKSATNANAQFGVNHEVSSGVPMMIDFWNKGALSNKLGYNMCSSSGAAGNAECPGAQLHEQYPSGSSSQERERG